MKQSFEKLFVFKQDWLLEFTSLFNHCFVIYLNFYYTDIKKMLVREILYRNWTSAWL